MQETIPHEWLWVLEEIKGWLEQLPPEGGRRLFEMWEQIPERRTGQEGALTRLAQLCKLLIRMSEDWPNYRVFDYQKDMLWTNNGTERVIGRMQVRSKPERGYKTRSGMLAGLIFVGSGVG